MLWPFKKRFTPSPCFPVGSYRIDTSIDGLSGLTPASPFEIAMLDPGFTFEGERIWHAPPAEFMELSWETMLGTVNGAIYKISIQYTGPGTQTGKTYGRIVPFLTRLYGDGENMTAWDASDGNIILHGGNIGVESILTVTLTSSKIRQFKIRSSGD